MSDQQPDIVAHDNTDPPTNHRPDDAATDQPPADPPPLSLDAAAAQLGISVNAVRQRIKRGTLAADKTAAGWVVFIPTNHDDTIIHGRRPTDQPATPLRPETNRPPDQGAIAPLADLIADLSRENRELAAAAALWQERARYLGERLQALEAGPVAPDPGRQDDAHPPEHTDAPVGVPSQIPPYRGDSLPPTPARSWWRRLLGLG